MSEETDRIKRKITKGFAYFLWAGVAFIIFNTVMYIRADNPITVYTYETTKTEYKPNDLINVVSELENKATVNTLSNIYLRCGSNLFNLKQIELVANPTERRTVFNPVGVIPFDVYPPECRVESVLKVYVPVLPWLTRTFTEVYVSQDINVRSEL